jgi:membrane protease YdiL (CAAX protease family)
VSFLERLRALGWFLLAAGWFLFSDIIAFRAANGLSSGEYVEPLYRILLLFLLVCGYSLMTMLTMRRTRPAKAIGMDARPGWKREWGLGAAVGWSAVIACILPTAIIGGLVVTVFSNVHQIWVLVLDLIAAIVGTLAIELGFRGYAFYRLVDAMGPAMGTFFMAVIYAIWRTHAAPTTTAVVVFSFLFGWVLCLAALRTRAVWVSWGLHFAYVAVMSIFFGLPIAGGMNYSPIFASNAVGPPWITGDVQGPEGSIFGILVMLALLIVIVRVTSDLKYKYGFAEIIPGGIPVDLDAAARRQHEAAMANTAPAAPPLVQIQPALSQPPPAEHATEVTPATAPASDVPEAAVPNPNGADPPPAVPLKEPTPSTPDEEPPGPEAT